MVLSSKTNNAMCCAGACPRCHALVKLTVGIILLVNAYLPFAEWWTLIAWLLVIAGVLKLIKPSCGHCV